MVMTTLDAATQATLQKALYAYVSRYGGGQSLAEVRAIAGTILSAQEKVGALVSQGMEIEAWVDDLVQNFDPGQLKEPIWTAGEAAISSQAKRWRDNLETKTRATLDAYIQKYVPDLTITDLQDLVATVLPVVEDAQIAKDEAQRLIQHISEQFNWQAAMGRVIDPKWVFLADKTVQCMRHRDLEGTTRDVMNAYVYKFKPSLVELGTGLIEQAVKSVFNSKLQLDLDVGVDAETQRLLVKQVALKMKLMEADPLPSKTALEFAQELHDEVQRYRREQGLDTIDYTPEIIRTDNTTGSSALGGEMSVGINMLPSSSRSPVPPPHPNKPPTKG
jgi:hypothetical protein